MIKHSLLIIIALLSVSAYGAETPGPAGPPALKTPPTAAAKTRKCDYSRYGFTIELPVDVVKQTASPEENETLREVYTRDGLTYTISVMKSEGGSLTSTVIEKFIQNGTKELGDVPGAKRWELSSKQKILFKGYSALPQTGSEVRSIALAPLGDEASAILKITVAGSSERQRDVENQAKFTAFTSNIADTKPTVAAAPPVNMPSPPASNPVREPGAKQPGKPTVQSQPTQPATATKPPAAAPSASKPAKSSAEVKPAAVLKTGYIELEGLIRGIAEDKKTLVLSVDKIRLPKGTPLNLKPAREKTVILASIPPNAAPGKRLRVIGKNEGIGTPIKPEDIEVVANAN